MNKLILRFYHRLISTKIRNFMVNERETERETLCFLFLNLIPREKTEAFEFEPDSAFSDLSYSLSKLHSSNRETIPFLQFPTKWVPKVTFSVSNLKSCNFHVSSMLGFLYVDTYSWKSLLSIWLPIKWRKKDKIGNSLFALSGSKCNYVA